VSFASKDAIPVTDTLIPHPSTLTDPIVPVDVNPVLQRLHVFLGPILIAATFFVLLYNFWGGLIDPIIDFGRELYVPWRISQGAVLYRDITSFYGPFSPLFNGLCFYLFGASLLTLTLVNCIVLAMTTFLLHEIVRVVSARSTAAIVCIFFLVVFGFGKLLTTANFSYIAPYSHEATHGFVLSLGAIYCFIRYLRSLRNGWIAAVGLCTGLVFLTKPESFIALAGFLFLAVIAMRWAMGPAFRLMIVLPLLIIFAVLPIAAAVVYLAAYMPFSEAWHGTLGSWTFLSNATLTGGKFFRDSMGLQNPLARMTIIAKVSGVFLVLMGPAAFMAFMIPDGRRHQRAFGCGLGVISLLLLKEIFPGFQWFSTGDLMLVGSLALVICQGILLIRHRRDPAIRIRLTLRLLFCSFAILMLLKMPLLTRYYHYGFILGVMATSMLAIALVDWIPAALERHGQCGWIVRGASIAMLAAIAIQCTSISHSYRPSSHSFIGQGKDQFRAQDAHVLQEMLQVMQTQIPPDGTLTVLPEGAILNFLARRPSSTPFVSFLPPDVDMFTEPRLLESLQQNPPDYIAILHRPTQEFGPAAFGTHYATAMYAWIKDNYSLVHRAGALPYSSKEFGIVLGCRKVLAPSTGNPPRQ